MEEHILTAIGLVSPRVKPEFYQLGQISRC